MAALRVATFFLRKQLRKSYEDLGVVNEEKFVKLPQL
jgi:hypothetical protein